MTGQASTGARVALPVTGMHLCPLGLQASTMRATAPAGKASSVPCRPGLPHQDPAEADACHPLFHCRCCTPMVVTLSTAEQAGGETTALRALCSLLLACRSGGAPCQWEIGAANAMPIALAVVWCPAVE